MLRATIEGENADDFDPEPLCPFSEKTPDEDRLAERFLPAATLPHHEIGRHLATYVGYVQEQDYRDAGSSGGMGTWLLAELLRTGRVDHVIHVVERRPTPDNPLLFEYTISSDQAALRAGAKSRYHPIEMSAVLRMVADQPGRYAIIGVPCFIKAVRLQQINNPVFAERIVYCVSLFCGHLKSLAFAQYLAWQTGTPPRDLRAIDFRRKIPNRPASQYGITVVGENDGARYQTEAAMSDLDGKDWGHGYFKVPACEYCDDVVGETADVCVGDAWLPGHVRDSRGTNVLIVRHPELQDMIDQARASGRLALEPLTADAVAASQSSGFRHRRMGLAYRLHLKDRAGQWRPPKRVNASGLKLHPVRRKIFALREKLMWASHAAFAEAVAADDVNAVAARLAPLREAYRKANHQSIRKGVHRLKNRLVQVVRRQATRRGR